MENSIISQTEVNTGRQPEIDVAKAVAIVLMVFCHVGIHFAQPGTLFYDFFDLIGTEWCAPVFMFCMGVGIVYSGSSTPELMVHRGVRLFLMGYALNFIRGVLPELIAIPLGAAPLAYGWLISLLIVDILPFAGLAMITMGLFKKWKLHPLTQVCIAVLLEAISELLVGRSTGSIIADQLVGLIYPVSRTTCFSLFNWLIFPVCGQLYGLFLRRCRDKETFYRSVLPVSALISVYVIGVQIACVFFGYDYYSGGMYYGMGIKPAFLAMFVILTSFSLGYFISKHLSAGVEGIVKRFSANLNSIYCVSWVLIFWTLLLTKGVFKVQLSNFVILVLMFAILAASEGIVELSHNFHNKNN